MWWKKLLYFLLVIVLGFGITVISGSINFHAQTKTLLKNYVNDKNYAMVERFFCYTTPKEEMYKFKYTNSDNSHIDIYPCLVKHPYYVQYPDGSHNIKYDIVEEALSFSLFHLPSNFYLEDKADSKGRIELFFTDNTSLDLDFDNRDKEEENVNYFINFYSFVSQFYSLTVYITYNDYITFTNDENIKISNIKIYDGSGQEFYNHLFNNPIGFDGSMHTRYKDACQEYREFMLEYGQTIAVGAYEEKNRLLKNIDEITKNNADNYFLKPSTNIIFTTTSFILTISITLSAYISIAIVITRLIFRKRKRH